MVPFVDAHVHLWDLGRPRYPWLTPPFAVDGPNGSVEAIACTYLPAEYRAEMARWNVVGAVHVDAGAHPDDALMSDRDEATAAEWAWPSPPSSIRSPAISACSVKRISMPSSPADWTSGGRATHLSPSRRLFRVTMSPDGLGFASQVRSMPRRSAQHSLIHRSQRCRNRATVMLAA